jgi:tetratricopeptide (TPR) repeat protein
MENINLHKIANDLYENNQYNFAIKIYDELINNNYNLSIIYSNKAACFLQMKEYKNALENSLMSVQYDLKNSIAWGRIGSSYKGLKMFAESLSAYETAHKLNKNNSNYLQELIFLHKWFNNKINTTNIFNLLLNNKILFEKLKKKKSDILSGNIDETTTFIKELMNEL